LYTTATNYGSIAIYEGANVPALSGPDGNNGPFLQIYPDFEVRIPQNILTETHCRVEDYSSIDCYRTSNPELFRFVKQCLSGKRIDETSFAATKLRNVSYDRKLVKQAIHVIRNPLDNVVARFNSMTETSKNAEGFQQWCADLDRNFVAHDNLPTTAKEKIQQIPCKSEFLDYVQWHNLAFNATSLLCLSTMVLFYDDYEIDYEGTRNKVIDFLGVPFIGTNEMFQPGKTYSEFYTEQQRTTIHEFLHAYASDETWMHISKYFPPANTSNLTAMSQ
jgi:hypothetical protein